ncbi:hypothetical protein EV426DRAFT_712600 [Tirmania nivea]|nr:hypothetical protein EV426DRAFT_712600 [Tirmania nivea]
MRGGRGRRKRPPQRLAPPTTSYLRSDPGGAGGAGGSQRRYGSRPPGSGRNGNVGRMSIWTAWSDGSRQEEVTAAAVVGGDAAEEWEEGGYLGPPATVMDAEKLGVVRAWQAGRAVVALDTQGAIGRLRNLVFEQPRSWIEERQSRKCAKEVRR